MILLVEIGPKDGLPQYFSGVGNRRPVAAVDVAHEDQVPSRCNTELLFGIRPVGHKVIFTGFEIDA